MIERALDRAPLSRKKEFNARLNWREFWHGALALRSFPRVVQVGTNWTCNLRCAFCRLSMPWTREHFRALPPTQLQLGPRALEAVRRLLPYAEMMTLTPLGEPLLWSGLGDLLEVHARAGSHNLALTTNGMALDEPMAERLVRAGLAALYFSVDSNDPQVYASMRVGGDLRRVEAGIRRVGAWKERLRSPWPVVTINATFLARNIGQLPSMVDWARGLGCEALSVQLMEIENPELDGEFLGRHVESAAAALEAALRLGAELNFKVLPHAALTTLIEAARAGRDVAHHYTAASPYLPDDLKQQPTTHNSQLTTNESLQPPASSLQPDSAFRIPHSALLERCSLPWHNLLIDTDGEARPCCWANVSWGNLERMDWDEVWNGPQARGMRQAFLRNVIPHSCRKRHCRVDL